MHKETQSYVGMTAYTKTVTKTFDASGNKATEAYPSGSNLALTYAWNDIDNLSSISDGTNTIASDAWIGVRRKTETFQSGAKRTNLYTGFREEIESVRHETSALATIVRLDYGSNKVHDRLYERFARQGRAIRQTRHTRTRPYGRFAEGELVRLTTSASAAEGAGRPPSGPRAGSAARCPSSAGRSSPAAAGSPVPRVRLPAQEPRLPRREEVVPPLRETARREFSSRERPSRSSPLSSRSAISVFRRLFHRPMSAAAPGTELGRSPSGVPGALFFDRLPMDSISYRGTPPRRCPGKPCTYPKERRPRPPGWSVVPSPARVVLGGRGEGCHLAPKGGGATLVRPPYRRSPREGSRRAGPGC